MNTPVKSSRHWKLDVYVVDNEPRCVSAIANLKKICNRYLSGRYRIHVLDLKRTPSRAQKDQILALPTVVRRLPLPERRAIGTLEDLQSVMTALELETAS